MLNDLINVVVMVMPFVVVRVRSELRARRGDSTDKLVVATTPHQIKMTYRRLMNRVCLFWFCSCAYFLLVVWRMKTGLGEDWWPLTRAATFYKSTPEYSYTLLALPMFLSGALALSGLLWVPMYFLFEWLEVSKKIRQLEVTEGKNA